VESVRTNHAEVSWIGLAFSGAPIANGRGYILIREVQVHRFALTQVKKPGGKCIVISHSSGSVVPPRSRLYIHCGYNRDGYN